MQKFIDTVIGDYGRPVPGASITVYNAGTSTPATIYLSNGGAATTNPVTADSTGMFYFYAADGRYDLLVSYSGNSRTISDIYLEDAADASAINVSNLTATNADIGSLSASSAQIGGSPAATSATLITPSTGAAIVGYVSDLTSAVNRTVQSVLREKVSVKDFGAVGNGVTDDSAAILLAVKSNREVFFPAGTYILNSHCSFLNLTNVKLVGAGIGATVIKCNSAATFTSIPIRFSGCTNAEMCGFTIDQDNNTSLTSSSLPLVQAVNSFDFRFHDNEIKKFTYIGLSINSCQGFWVINNKIEKDTAVNTTNYAINISSDISLTKKGFISRNNIKNSGIGVYAYNIYIQDNTLDSNKYGGGIATFTDGTATYGSYKIIGNTVFNNTGTDADGFLCCGLEIAGHYSLIKGNIVYDNDGEGIRVFAYRSIVAENLVYNNGKGLGGTYLQGGIVAYYSTSTYSASYTTFTGNMCFDTGGGTQLYGYAEQSSSLTGSKISNNNFQNNATAEMLTASTTNLFTDSILQVSTTAITASKPVTLSTAGHGLSIKEGSNAKMGTATLVAGTVTVSNTSVTANSRIFLTSNADGGIPGFLRVSARSASTSFTITSSSVIDTSTVAWLILEPA